jgi:hypothetical protein
MSTAWTAHIGTQPQIVPCPHQEILCSPKKWCHRNYRHGKIFPTYCWVGKRGGRGERTPASIQKAQCELLNVNLWRLRLWIIVSQVSLFPFLCSCCFFCINKRYFHGKNNYFSKIKRTFTNVNTNTFPSMGHPYLSSNCHKAGIK